MTLVARLAALERRRPPGWIVLGERIDGGPTTYTLCPRHRGDAPRRLTAEESAAFAAAHRIVSLRVYARGSLPPIDDEGGQP
jgi:hypothetical protein